MSIDRKGPLRRFNVASPALIEAVQALLCTDGMEPLDDRAPPPFDNSVKTVFLKRTIPRAVTPRSTERVRDLRQLESLIARQEAGKRLGMEMAHLAKLARTYPISHRAMRAELRDKEVQRLVEVAEQVELRLWSLSYPGQLLQ